MKSNEEIMNIISTGIIKRFCCFIFFVGLLTGVYAQKSEISINLELLTVVQSDYRPLALRKVKGDTIPVRMIFFFRVINHTNKPILFGSNTRHYYQKKWDNSKYGIIGEFLMINRTDTIALYTEHGALIPNNLQDSITYWATMECIQDSKKYPVFVPFFRYWGNSGKDWIAKLYNYLKESHFIYLPISSDYQRRLDKFEDKATLDSITYPREIIDIKKREPFSICISEEFKEDYYYFYPK